MGEAVFLCPSLPRMGKVASIASRIGFQPYENHTGHESKNLGTNCPYLYLEGESVQRSYDTMINFGEIR